MSSDLVTFVRARLDEDEQVARTAIQAAGGADWRHSDGRFYPEDNPSQHPGPFLADVYEADPGFGEHIARHDPARVLREVEAKRMILTDYERYAAERRRAMNGWWEGDRDPSPILRALALPYADHPDYRAEWSP